MYPDNDIILLQINPYVNGALYSLLGNQDINLVAQNMGIENKIVEKCQVVVLLVTIIYSVVCAGVRGRDEEAVGVHLGST